MKTCPSEAIVIIIITASIPLLLEYIKKYFFAENGLNSMGDVNLSHGVVMCDVVLTHVIFHNGYKDNKAQTMLNNDISGAGGLLFGGEIIARCAINQKK